MEKIKKIIWTIGIGIFTVMSFIGGIFLYNHAKSDERTDRLTKDLSDTAKGLRNTNQDFGTANTRLSEIIEDIKKTRHGDNY